MNTMASPSYSIAPRGSRSVNVKSGSGRERSPGAAVTFTEPDPSLLAQRDHRIDERRLPRRDVARRGRDAQEQHRHAREHDEVVLTDAEQQALQEARQQERAAKAEDQPDPRGPQALSSAPATGSIAGPRRAPAGCRTRARAARRRTRARRRCRSPTAPARRRRRAPAAPSACAAARSDRDIHWSIVRTSAIGCSGSIDWTAARTCGHERRRIQPRLQDERHGGRPRLLRDRIVQPLFRHRLREVDAVDRADDADDRERRSWSGRRAGSPGRAGCGRRSTGSPGTDRRRRPAGSPRCRRR